MARRRRGMRRASSRWANKSWSALGGLLNDPGLEGQTPVVSGMWAAPLLTDLDFSGNQAAQERVTSRRIVGEFALAPSLTDTGISNVCSIAVLPTLAGGVPAFSFVAGTETDPGDVNWFVKQRILWTGVGFSGSTAGDSYRYTERVDVKVNVKLEDGLGIFLCGSSRGIASGDELESYILMMIRVLFND